MIRFELLEPANLEEACSMLANNKGAARVMAGGHGLLPLLKHRLINPKYFINIKNLSNFDYIKTNDSHTIIGALTTNRVVELSSPLTSMHPMLTEIEHYLGDVQIRNWSTLVGNLCMATPTSDLAPALIALNSTVNVVGVDSARTIPLDCFYVDYLKTVLKPDEIVTEVQIPNPLPRTGSAYHKERVRAKDSPIASVAAVVTLNDQCDSIVNIRIILQAVCPTPLRAEEAEDALLNHEITDELLEEAAMLASQAACPISDIYGSAEYKHEMVRVITRKVIAKAIERAQKG
jgi:carbon-monoxide dehydrogenase medium subunit